MAFAPKWENILEYFFQKVIDFFFGKNLDSDPKLKLQKKIQGKNSKTFAIFISKFFDSKYATLKIPSSFDSGPSNNIRILSWYTLF